MATHPCNPSIWKVEAGENCNEFEANCRGVKTLFQEAKNKLNVIKNEKNYISCTYNRFWCLVFDIVNSSVINYAKICTLT